MFCQTSMSVRKNSVSLSPTSFQILLPSGSGNSPRLIEWPRQIVKPLSSIGRWMPSPAVNWGPAAAGNRMNSGLFVYYLSVLERNKGRDHGD